MTRTPDGPERGAGAKLKAFSPAPDPPEGYYPPDIISKEVGGIQQFADSLGGFAEYNEATTEWIIAIGAKSGTNEEGYPTLRISPNPDYNGKSESFKPSVSFMSADGSFSFVMEQVTDLGCSTEEKGIVLKGTMDGGRVICEVGPQGAFKISSYVPL